MIILACAHPCGPAAQALFSTPEVLVAAEDLINDSTICVDHALREVTYIHRHSPSVLPLDFKVA